MSCGTPALPKLEFRIPISPTESFFAQVRFFETALRRLGGAYESARLVVVVGDKCDLEEVRKRNFWSAGRNVVWLKVPDETFDRYGLHGTADWRFMVDPDAADIIILSDADTVLVRDIDPLFPLLSAEHAVIAGHMAHLPPPYLLKSELHQVTQPELWHLLFSDFGVAFPEALYPYSMDVDRSLPLAPAYFNLGFVGLNQAALAIFRRDIFDVEDRIMSMVDTFMRCQIACTLIAYRERMHIERLSAAYNCPNDDIHFRHNDLTPKAIRVIHYLRTNEIDRTRIFLPANFPQFLTSQLHNPVNVELQQLARELAPAFAVSPA